MSDKLTQLKKFTVVVADTGKFEDIKKFAPQDATTNPSLLFQAAQSAEYAPVVKSAIARGKKNTEKILDELSVAFGCKILEIIPGRVSTEVDARLSFDTDKTLAKARRIIKLYESSGINRKRILIKIAATWEGIRAAEILEKEGIRCNLTLLFSEAQAIACALAKVTLISPFVGRITDWYKQHEGKDSYAPKDDPGVKSVKRIFNYYKKYGYKTIVMGASFRAATQIEELAGCDYLTISPALLEQLQGSRGTLTRKLSASEAARKKAELPQHKKLSESEFRWMHNSDAAGVFLLSDGIRRFASDLEKLEAIIKARA